MENDSDCFVIVCTQGASDAFDPQARLKCPRSGS